MNTVCISVLPILLIVNLIESFCPCIGAKLEYDSRALSLKRLRQSYPEGNGNGYCRGMTCNAYEKLGFRWQEQAIGEMEVIRKKFAYRNHVDGEKLHISCFHASRDPSFKK